jgi:hypothetical protein
MSSEFYIICSMGFSLAVLPCKDLMLNMKHFVVNLLKSGVTWCIPRSFFILFCRILAETTVILTVNNRYY